MISTYYRRPDAGAAAAPMFDPAALIDPLTDPVPTWRINGEVAPVYLAVVRDLGIPGLGEPTSPAGDVVEGVVLEGPPTVPLAIVGPPTVPLPLAEIRRQPKRRTRKRPNRQRQREAGHGSIVVILFVVLLAVVVVALMGGFLEVASDMLDFARVTPVFPSMCDGGAA